MKSLQNFLKERKFELLLAALIQHLFIGIFLSDLDFYTKVIWPINMVILGIASAGIFIEKGKIKARIQGLLFLIVVLLPVSSTIFGHIPNFMSVLSIIYVIFFTFILFEIIRFLIKPGYINIDIISASACGYFLLIEISVFLMQTLFYYDTSSFKGIDVSNSATTYTDFVYFSSITLTSIGFGDIVPTRHYTKLLTAFFGIAGQFYLVVLVGILISKFSSKEK